MSRLAPVAVAALLTGCAPGTDVKTLDGPGPEIHHVPTTDGAHVALTHLPGDGPPVVLVHGISSNHHFWDLLPDRSLARHLNDAGYDVWNMDLRGHGAATTHPDGRRQRSGWTVDDYGRHDLPAAFDFVRTLTGEDRLHYVGHSMGGMVLAVYLATHPVTPLASATVVGSPLDFRDPDRITRFALGASWLGTATGFLPTPAASDLLALVDRAPLRVDDLLFNPEHVGPDVRAEMYRRIVSPLSRGELRQLGRSRADGEFRSVDGAVAYRTALDHVTVPMLFLAGRADRVAAPDRVWSYFDAVGSDDKAFVVASEANGFAVDYGHLDLGVGDHARVDVFPRILDWLRTHP